LLIKFAPVADAEVSARDWSQLERWCRQLESRYAHARVARPLIIGYPPELMWDGIHLNAAGVEKFMPIVAKDVQAVLKERGHGVSSTF